MSGLVMGEGTCSLLLHPDSILSVHVCYPRGVLFIHWVCKVFSGAGD